MHNLIICQEASKNIIHVFPSSWLGGGGGVRLGYTLDENISQYRFFTFIFKYKIHLNTMPIRLTGTSGGLS